MSKRLPTILKNQTQVKVARLTRNANTALFWFITLAFFFAGVFYFWGTSGAF